jgi:hypothetical protein
VHACYSTSILGFRQTALGYVFQGEENEAEGYIVHTIAKYSNYFMGDRRTKRFTGIVKSYIYYGKYINNLEN